MERLNRTQFWNDLTTQAKRYIMHVYTPIDDALWWVRIRQKLF